MTGETVADVAPLAPVEDVQHALFTAAHHLGTVLTPDTATQLSRHANVISHKRVAWRRLWFLKKLKRAGVVREDLVYFYQAVVRPILEYASPVWHTSLTKEQTKSLEDFQRRALRVIIDNIPYEEACYQLNLPRLADRRHSLCRILFQQITNRQSHILHYLLPAKRDAEVTDRLRSMNKKLIPNSSCADKLLQKLIRIVWTI